MRTKIKEAIASILSKLPLLSILSWVCKVPKANPFIFKKFGGSVAMLTAIQTKTHATNMADTAWQQQSRMDK